ncbi:hypothetical protein [Shewanella salipaludis]|uniref:Uncharacterized protein n=1 Tax=Shewanella salipaludis TaxID=2723052 RepID=A0A972FYZ9_9GAMM|nr:hypothetical protein [Shewanella salipaludis]NMH64154.1 hypothetical protein [Shewanella salipaludis]
MQMNINSIGLTQAVASNRPPQTLVAPAQSGPAFIPPLPLSQSGMPTRVHASGDRPSSFHDSHLTYDSLAQGTEGAINQYMLTQNFAKRDEIQSMVGIDIYA